MMIIGWRFTIETPAISREVDLLLDRNFPWTQPRITFSDGTGFLQIPHIESDGVMCLLPGQAEVDPENPVGAVRNILAEASKLITENSETVCLEDFRQEFVSYWRSDNGAPAIRSLLNANGPSRQIKVWRGRGLYVVGENSRQVTQWTENHLGTAKEGNRKIESGVLLWLNETLVPSEYPQNAADVLAIAKSRCVGGEEILREATTSAPDRLLVLFGSQTANGPALAAIVIQKPQAENRGPGRVKVDPIARGFRPGHIPAAHTQKMLLGHKSVLKSNVTRVDASWVHGRGLDARQELLGKASVTLIGCGSLGSSVGALLAQAGVGKLSLVDPEFLAWTNIGRHVLGAGSVGHSKVEKLAEKLKRDYPHMRAIVSQAKDWQDVSRHHPGILTDADLIISTIGSWGSEGMLNEWHVSHGLKAPLLFGWTEPHAFAGQAVAIIPGNGCFACGLDRVGIPKLRVTEWPPGASTRQEPACGAVFQPYGPVELSYIIATISNLALDLLLGRIDVSISRIWSASHSRLQEAGGSWTKAWQDIAGGNTGDFLKELPWPKSAECRYCATGK